eukprot:3062593-Prymnesium_polylepis.1
MIVLRRPALHAAAFLTVLSWLAFLDKSCEIVRDRARSCGIVRDRAGSCWIVLDRAGSCWI